MEIDSKTSRLTGYETLYEYRREKEANTYKREKEAKTDTILGVGRTWMKKEAKIDASLGINETENSKHWQAEAKRIKADYMV